MIALTGDLGAGKTTFVQGFAEGLGIKARIVSPTFIIMRTYRVDGKSHRFHNFYHLDFYRIEGTEEDVESLGLTEVWNAPGSVVVVEWAEKIKDFLPTGTIWINFEVDGTKRKITLSDQGHNHI